MQPMPQGGASDAGRYADPQKPVFQGIITTVGKKGLRLAQIICQVEGINKWPSGIENS